VVCSLSAFRVPVKGRSRTSCRLPEVGWLVLGLRPAGACGVRSDSKEVWEQEGPKSECPSREPMAKVRPTNGGAYAHEGFDRGRSP